MATQLLVESAIPLTPAQLSTIEKMVLKAKKLRRVTVVPEVVPNLIGGLRITVGSTQYDASLLGKLNSLRKQ